MKLFSALIVLLLGAGVMAQQPSQIVINVERQDFKPLQEVNWRVLAGSASMNRSVYNNTSSGTGLGIGIERMLSARWSLGAHYANVNSVTSGSYGPMFNGETTVENKYEFRENFNMLNAYGKFNFVNFPINQWNLVQVSLLGGVMAYDKGSESIQPIYGASAAYNFDNLIGFELSSKVNFRAETSTSASLVGYF